MFEILEVCCYEFLISELNGLEEEKFFERKVNGLDYILLFLGMDLLKINYEEYNGKEYRYCLIVFN